MHVGGRGRREGDGEGGGVGGGGGRGDIRGKRGDAPFLLSPTCYLNVIKVTDTHWRVNAFIMIFMTTNQLSSADEGCG